MIERGKPSLFERNGVHCMRDIARKWCRENPEIARSLPHWRPEILKAVCGEPEEVSEREEVVEEKGPNDDVSGE